MKKSRKNLLILVVVMFILGGAITVIGALAKLQHWPWAGSALIIGMGMHAASYLAGGIILVQYIRSK